MSDMERVGEGSRLGIEMNGYPLYAEKELSWVPLVDPVRMRSLDSAAGYQVDATKSRRVVSIWSARSCSCSFPVDISVQLPGSMNMNR